MNTKLIKIIASISLGGGLLTTLPFTTTSCSSSKKPTKLECDSDIIPVDITGNLNSEISPTSSLSEHIKTDKGEYVSGVIFSCKNLTEQTGLTINRTTGVISGTLTKKPTNPEFKIKFVATIDGISLEGYTDTFTVTVNPTKLECDTDAILGNITGNLNSEISATASLLGHIKTDTGDSVTSVTFACESLTEQTGLTINRTTGIISGTLTKKPTNANFQIKFTANVDGKSLEGCTNTFTITVNPTKLECDSDTIPGNITGNVDDSITPTSSLLEHIKTDTGESVSGVTFTCTGLPNGLIIDQTTGVISGNPTEETNSQQYTVTFTALVDGKTLTGQIDGFTSSIGPKIPSSLTSNVNVYDEIRSTTTDVLTQELNGHIKTDTGVIVNKDDHGLSFTISQGSLPSGLSFNSDTGVISGKCTTSGTYKFKITANATVYGVDLSYQTDEFSITISNTILPDTVYKYADTKKTILAGFTDEFINDSSRYSTYNTMQIMSNITSIGDNAFYSDDKSLMPSFIKNLTFADNSNCTSIGGSAFQDSALTSVDFSNANSLETIYGYAFFRCRGITSPIILPSSIIGLKTYCFYQCWYVPSFDLTNCTELTSIGNGAFQECNRGALNSITLPDNITTIERYAFKDCTTLRTVDLSRCTRLTSIKTIAFSGCTALNTILWNLPTDYSTTVSIVSDAFTSVPTGGTFKCSTAGINLNDLKTWLENKGFPTGWTFTQ